MKKLLKHSTQDLSTKFYEKIYNILDAARSKAYRSVNTIMVQAYWEIGRGIIGEEQKGQTKAGYGEHLIENLSHKLTNDFGSGFDERNLRYMRTFYGMFPIWNAVRSELSWTHYRLLLKVENSTARDYYIQESIKSNWSTRQLERQINSFYYERTLSSRNKELLRKHANKSERPYHTEDIIRDPMVLEFLNIKNNTAILENQLEALLIAKLQDFLLELGRGFSFIARQKRISADNEHFYVDLVFYNYILKCFVLVDLKAGKLTHQDVGQMDFYVRYFEDKIKAKDDNPTIGIILCSDKNETIVKYSVLSKSKQLFASKYKLYLPTEKELETELKRELNEVTAGLPDDEETGALLKTRKPARKKKGA